MFTIVKLIVSLNKTPSFNKGNTLFHARKQSVSERRAAVAKLQKKAVYGKIGQARHPRPCI